MRVLKIIGKGAVAFYDELFYYMLYGLIHLVIMSIALIPVFLTFRISLPISPLYFLLWILVIPEPFALTGVYAIGQKAVRGLGVKWHTIWEGIKEFGTRSLLLFVIVVVVYVIFGANLWFYSNRELSPFPASVATWTTPLFAFLALLWTGVAFYAQAFLMELEKPSMGLVLRNSLFLTLLQPFQTLTLLVVSILSLALSIALPVLLIVWPGFVSCLALSAVRQLVAHLSERAEAFDSESESKEAEEKDDDATIRDGIDE